MDVDEAGRDHAAAHVHDPRGRLVDRRCDPRDLVAANRDVAGEPRRSRAVDDAPVLQEEIVGRGLRLERGERKERERRE